MDSKSVKARIGIIGVGLLANQLMVWGIDFFVDPLALYYGGLVWGSVAVMLISLVLCYLTILFYDWSKQDWLGIETLKLLKESKGGRMRRIIAWVLTKSDPIAMILLSIKFDPFIVTVYMRKGSYNGLSRRDWKIFLGSVFVGNLWWVFVLFTGMNAISWLWNIVKGLV
ncbi:MAG: hypothetical protein HQ402_00440 [Parcubacteria group bacterium]|nr:hypothetical protein [Parcubacteria group bacterium]